MDDKTHRLLRDIPQVQSLLAHPGLAAMVEAHGHARLVRALRAELDAQRAAILAGTLPAFDSGILHEAVTRRLGENRAGGLHRVINATGIVIHTNLGRAPLSAATCDAIQEIARGYSTLEYDLDGARRGSRHAHIESVLCELTGAEAAIAVNNNAAAVMLALNALAQDKEVIVSRGELVEIGGSFRVPDVITRNGARLVEVGTTNRTRIADYAQAVTTDSRVLLKVHRSNFRMTGFIEEASRGELAALARDRGLVFVEDLGSGTLVDLRRFGLPHEPTVAEAVAAGADVVTFSGDKLLGGPQAGIAVGRAAPIATMKRDPLMRALRVDKLCLAALSATLDLYLDPDAAARDVPVLRMLSRTLDSLGQAASELSEALRAAVPGIEADVIDTEGYSGGGALPGEAMASKAVAIAIAGRSEERLAEALRRNDPPIIARIEKGRVLLDLRTLLDSDIPDILCAMSGQVPR